MKNYDYYAKDREIIQTRLKPIYKNKLIEYCKKYDLTISELIRSLCIEFIDQNNL